MYGDRSTPIIIACSLTIVIHCVGVWVRVQTMVAARKAAVEHSAPVLVEFMTYREGVCVYILRCDACEA